MTTRTFKQFGSGYGPNPVSIKATLDGVVVHDGPVYTKAGPPPENPSLPGDLGQELYTWQHDVDYFGQQVLEITVTNNGPFMLTGTLANFPSWSATSNIADPGNTWAPPYVSNIGTPGGMIITDPLQDEKINGVPQSTEPVEGKQGQWWWILKDGEVFTANVIIKKGSTG